MFVIEFEIVVVVMVMAVIVIVSMAEVADRTCLGADRERRDSKRCLKHILFLICFTLIFFGRGSFK